MQEELPKTIQILPFKWTKLKETAALEVSQDELSDEAIAANAGVTRRSLVTWKQHPEFQARVTAHIEEFKRRVLSHGIAVREKRVAAQHKRWLLMQQVIAERGADPAMQDVPGGKTGLIVHQIKGVGKGEDFQLIDIYQVDDGLLAELRAHEKQAAEELGQWATRTELTGKDGSALQVGITEVVINKHRRANPED